MIALALVGAGIGAVLFTLIRWWIPPRPSPLVTLGRFDAYHQNLTVSHATAGAPGAGLPGGPGGGVSWQTRVGALLAAALQQRGITYTSLRQDLALTGRAYDAVMGRKVVAFAGGFVLALIGVIALQDISGLALPPGGAAVAAFLIGAGFFFLPDLEARAEAGDRRRDFRRDLGAYLDLVALEMAGSAAPTEALPSAARVGAGWTLALIRDTLYQATLAGTDPWLALAGLGERIGVPELRDLGALVRLVDQDGAQIRDTLTARAASMRRKELADAEGEASERDQSIQLAQLLIGFGFVVFIGYPALAAVTSL